MFDSILWPSPPANPCFVSSDEVHVWVASVALAGEHVERLRPLLSEQEHRRAASFRGVERQRQFIAARGQARDILARYLGRDPRSIEFTYTEHGKPRLASDGRASIDFNIAHSHRLALVAVSAGACVGVDIEQTKAFDDMADVAASFFSEAERRELARAPSSDYVAAFYRCWTRKEAYLKAIGTGLFTPLDSFDVSLAVEAPAVLRDANDPDVASRWSVCHLAPADDHIGSLVAETARPTVSRWSIVRD